MLFKSIIKMITLKEKIEKYLLQVKSPSRYIGGELNSVIKDKSNIDVRFAFCFPDSYDVGMSHLGMKILYSLINERENYWCERVFAPWADFEKLMRDKDIPLYGLESLEPIKDFDFIGFTVQYELCYTNILNMLDLAGLPVKSCERLEKDYPVVVAGGPCVCNPEPIADFIDVFILGEGEEVNLEFMDLYAEMKKQGKSKLEFLEAAAKIEGIYVPMFYDVTYNEDGTVKAYTPNNPNAKPSVKKRIIKDFNNVYYPKEFVVPFCEIVHDRSVVEVLRGCIRGCRFCQAGFIYRPFREKTSDTIRSQTKYLCESTGYEEVSLSSLSTSDLSDLDNTLKSVAEYTESVNVNLSMPSMRIDKFSEELMNEIQKVRKSGLTFAPEAGTQRLRDVINKNITDDEIFNACRLAFSGGYTTVKLYFMLGLPFETDDDIIGIARLTESIADLYYQNPNKQKGQRLQISVSCATFIPKPFTPFEFEPQASEEEIKRKQKLLIDSFKSRKCANISWHNYRVSILEAVLARGDRRLCDVVFEAWKSGCTFDSWDECYRFDLWMKAFEKCSIDTAFYALRKRSFDEVFPWDHLDYMVEKDFLIRENKLAGNAVAAPNCREKCSGCGVSKALGGACFG